jgi:predicted ATPase
MIPSPSLMVITGGPGSGKSTLIEALAREGYATAAPFVVDRIPQLQTRA